VSERGPRCADDAQLFDAPSGGQLIGHVQQWAHENIVPLNASIELTLRCNIRCLHCYNFYRDEPRAACDTPELSTAEILRVMGELREAGCLFLMFTGGEVLSHPELFTFMDRARELNFALQLLTNGTMLRPGIAARLASYENLQGVSISLYGATAEVHDAVTQMPGSWRRTWDGVRRLGHLGIKVRLKFLVMRQNQHEAAAMRAQAQAEGFPYTIDLAITARHDGSRGSFDTRVSPEQIEELFRGPLNDFVPRRPRDVSDEAWACNCARGNLAVTATGEIHPCVSVPCNAGNVREQSIADIWRASPVFQRIRGRR
jgi:MoaA/NifB/PqqE/SkfB family radical SAM enzyme